MTAAGTTTNIAQDSAHVGVQAGVVHKVNLYHVPPDATPLDKFRVGVRYLDNGMPEKARDLIDEAIVRGHVTSEARFHQLLALLSGRTVQMLSDADFRKLELARGQALPPDADDWTDGIQMIDRLLTNMSAGRADQPITPQEFDKLADTPRSKIARHLEMFLQGPIEDRAWDQALQRAVSEQNCNDREQRAWKFFQPTPAAPRLRPVPPVPVTIGTWAGAVLAAITLTAAAGHIGFLLMRQSAAPALVAYLVGVVGGGLGAVNGVKWRYRNERLRAKELDLAMPRQRRSAPAGGFAHQVDQYLDRYFRRYVPDGMDRRAWLAETAGIRRRIRDELVESYRETRVKADAIAWLIRYRVGEVKRSYTNGSLWDHRIRFKTPVTTKIATLTGIGLLAGGAVRALATAIRINPLQGSVATLVILASGSLSAVLWLRITVERRRYADQLDEGRRLFADHQAAYGRWLNKLADRPSDSEMATWLDCDRMVLMGEAMRQYKLRPSNVLAHAFLEARVPKCKHARVLNGPWRYARYEVLTFLLTTDGVRQVSAELNFLNATFLNRARLNYRFDAVASVRVEEGLRHERIFALALVNGYEDVLEVTGSGEELLHYGEGPGSVANLTVDAAGLGNTLHILEGIAAEGKDWITHEEGRSSARIARLQRAVHGLVE